MGREFESLSEWMRTPLERVSKDEVERREREKRARVQAEQAQLQAQRAERGEALARSYAPIYWKRFFFCGMCDTSISAMGELAVDVGGPPRLRFMELRHSLDARLAREDRELVYDYLKTLPTWQQIPTSPSPYGGTPSGPDSVLVLDREPAQPKAHRKRWWQRRR